jgi:hypothetical protein
MEKLSRFTLENGEKVITTIKTFAEKYCQSKCIAFKSAHKMVTRHQFNCMDWREQKEYESKRERAVPEYRVSKEDGCFWVTTKKEWESIDLPIVKWNNESKYLLKYKAVEVCCSYEDFNMYSDTKKVLKLAARDVQKQVIELLKACGYIHSQNCFDEIVFKTTMNYVDATCEAKVGEDNFSFHYSGHKSDGGIADFCLLRVDKNGDRLMTNGHQTYSFVGYMKKIGMYRDSKPATCLY